MPPQRINCFFISVFLATESVYYLNRTKHMNAEFFNTYRSNVELNSAALYVIPRPMSSSYRQVILKCFMLVFPKLLLRNGCF
jgi:hypothetical protein